jgi:hypothetical protein
LRAGVLPLDAFSFEPSSRDFRGEASAVCFDRVRLIDFVRVATELVVDVAVVAVATAVASEMVTAGSAGFAAEGARPRFGRALVTGASTAR